MVICVSYSDPLLGITKITSFNLSLEYCGGSKLGYVYHNKLEANWRLHKPKSCLQTGRRQRAYTRISGVSAHHS